MGDGEWRMLAVLEQNVNVAGWVHDMVRFRRLWRPVMCEGMKEVRGREKLTAQAAYVNN